MNACEAHELTETARGMVSDMTQTIKKLALSTMVACALCLTLASSPAWASTEPGVELAKVDGADAVSVTLTTPTAPRDDVRALSLSLEVAGIDPAKTDVSFAFDDSLSGVSVKDARVVKGEDSYRVNLYVAGEKKLYENDRLALGKLVFAGSDNAKADVSVVENSLQVVNAAHVLDEPSLDTGQSVLVELGKAPESSHPDTPDNPDMPSTDDGDDTKDEGEHTNNDSGTGSDNNTKPNPDANRSPGAPSGTDDSLVPTGDGLSPLVTTLAGCLAMGSAVLGMTLLRRFRNR